MDFVNHLVRKRGDGGWKYIRKIAALSDPAEAYGVEELVAAGEVVAWVKGHGKHVPNDPQFDSWLEKQGSCVPAGLAADIERKLKEAAKTNLGWVRPSDDRAWKRGVLDLARRLRLR